MQIVMWCSRGAEGAQIEVSGLSMAQRAGRAMAHAGHDRALVLGPGAAAIAARMNADRWSPGLEAEAAEVTPGEESLERALRARSEQLDGEFVLVECDRVLSPKVFEVLEGAGRARAAVGPSGDVLALRVGAGEVLALEPGARGLEDLAEELGARRAEVAGAHHMVVRTRAQAREAKARLFRTLRKPLARQADGLTAYFINRPVSLACSRVLVNFPVSPNHVTGFNVGLALLGGAMIMTAEPLWIALGAMMMQLVSIFDGIDGEIARVKLEMSEAGAWFDVAADDVARMAMYVPLGYACYVLHQQSMFLALAGTGFLFTVMMVTRWYIDVIARGGNSANGAQWWFEAPGRERNAWNLFLIGFSYFLKRDTYTLILALVAAAGFPAVSFVMMTVGINIIFFATFLQRLNRDEAGELVAAPIDESQEIEAARAR
jgi:phosphatidylglycerophosphate synthase